MMTSYAAALESSSKRDCVVCHVMWLEDFRTEDETLIEWQPGNVLMKDTQGVVSSEEICYSCHDGYVLDSRYKTWKYNRHPVFVKPSKNVTVPDDLPLSVKGEIYCGTCHSAHGRGAAAEGNPEGRTKVFREVNTDSSLCEKCHRNELSYKSSNSHPLHTTALELSDRLFYSGSKSAVNRNEIICETCHSVHGAQGEKILVVKNDNSELCVICHEKQDSIIATKHDLRTTGPDEKNIKHQTARESGPCGACHVPHNAAGKKLWAKPYRRGNFASRTCLSCHDKKNGHKIKGIGEYSHPVNVSVPEKMELPDNLPLYSRNGTKKPGGEIQCFTCHDVHTWDPVSPGNKGGKDIEGDPSNSFLRTANTSSLMCMECHIDKKQVEASDHNLLVTAPDEKNIQGLAPSLSGPCGACHVPHNAAAEKLWARELSGEGECATQLCNSCHGEEGPAKDKLVGDHSHPVGISIKDLDIITTLPLYDSVGVKAVDGKMTCITCHDPHTWSPDKTVSNNGHKNVEGDATNSFLRMANTSSSMCVECHTDKKQVEMSDHNLLVTAPEEKNIQGLTTASSGLCGACHVPHNAAAGKLWAKELSGEGDLATRLCAGCHNEKGAAKEKFVGDYSHPVNVTLERLNITTDLPLFDNEGHKTSRGRVACMTCHDPHTWSPDKITSGYGGRNIEGDATNSFLRMANFPSSSLCNACHKEKAFIEGTDHDLGVTAADARNILGQTVKDSGKCGVCHLVHNSPNKLKLWARPYGNVSSGEDIINSLCTSCHSSGNIAENKIPATAAHPGNAVVSNILRLDMNKADYTPLFDKDTGEDAHKGNISCPSCHNAHQWSARVKEKGSYQNIEGNATNSFLRNLSYNNICIDCHGLDGLFRFKYFHDPNDRAEVRGY